MTYKDAYYILIEAWHGNKDDENHPNFDDINEALYTLNQAVERLETLENQNAALKIKVRAWEIQGDKYKQENEKLKKAIEIFKKSLTIEFNDDLQFVHLKEDVSQSCDYTIADIEDKQEYELLKEVLENE